MYFKTNFFYIFDVYSVINYGLTIKNLHFFNTVYLLYDILMQNGASMFFITIYTHIFRGLYYTSYAYPKQLLWASGIIVFLLMMATAFLGYILPWGS